MFKRRISAKFARLVVGLFVSVFLCATPAFAGNLSEVQAIYDRLIYDSQNIDDDDFFDDNQWQVIDTSQYVTGVVGNNADQAEHTVCPAYAYCSNECGADGHEDMYWLYHDDGQTVSDLQTELSSVMRAPSNVRDNTWKNTFAQAGRFLCPSNTVGRARSVSGNGYDPRVVGVGGQKEPVRHPVMHNWRQRLMIMFLTRLRMMRRMPRVMVGMPRARNHWAHLISRLQPVATITLRRNSGHGALRRPHQPQRIGSIQPY